MKPWTLLVGVCLVAGSAAQTYLGADNALKAITKYSAAPRPANPEAVMRRLIASYSAKSKSLTPAQSARQWIALADRCDPTEAIWVLSDRSWMIGNSAFANVMAALPAPSVWPELERQLSARMGGKMGRARNLAMLALIQTLRGKRDGARTLLAQIKGLSYEQKGLLSHVNLDLALAGGRSDQIEKAYRELAITLSMPTQPIGGEKSISLPDLDAMLGLDRAKALLGDLFRTFDGELVVDGSKSFRKMAREVALKDVAKLKHPQWSLAIDVDGGPLFEAVHRRFPDSARGIQTNRDSASDSYSAAASRYLVDLVANDRIADADAFVGNQDSSYWFGNWVNDEEVAYLKTRNKIDSYIAFLESMISARRQVPSIDTYLNFCVVVGRSERAAKFIAGLPKSAGRPFRKDWERTLDGLLKENQIEAAGELLKKVVQMPPDPDSNSSSYPNAISKLFDVGRYLNRQDYIDQAISAGKSVILKEGNTFINGWVVYALVDTKRSVEAEGLLADVLQKEAHDGTVSSPPPGKEEFEYLVRVYDRSDRMADVVTLLEQAPVWGCADVAFLGDESKRQNSIPFIAARALAAVGRKKEALRVLHFVLQSQRDLDQAYELLLKLDPTGSGALLDRMHRVSPMAPRPLMWKAELLCRNGRLDAAEQMVRRAIALDPQDSQAWESQTRFQAWEILARIERAQGKAESARVHRLKFDSLRKYYTNNGSGPYLLEIDGPAWRLEAIQDNPDDFALRFAVASDYRATGNRAAEKAQIEAACRLLPSQIGQAGTVQGFEEDPEFVRICEQVLVQELQKTPGRASTYAVLGELYQTAGRYATAKDAYSKAVALDRDNLVAWDGLHQLEDHFTLTPDLRDKVFLNRIRLAPLERIWPDTSIRDFDKVWLTAAKAVEGALSVEEPVFTLAASDAALNSAEDQNLYYSRRQDWPPAPGWIVAQDRAIADFVRLLGTLPGAAKAKAGNR